MIAAMMLPGAAPAVFENCKRPNWVCVVPLFVGAYVAVWTAVGAARDAVRIVYWPHTSLVVGTTAIAAGVYELTPVKNRFRERCRAVRRSGLRFAVHCVGFSSGRMLMQLLMDTMNIAWMLTPGALMLAQKALPFKPKLDVPVALALVGFGILLVLAPWSVPEVHSPM